MTPESMHHTHNQISKMLPDLDKLLSVENPAAPTEIEAEIEDEIEENNATIPITLPRASFWLASSNLTIARGASGPANPDRSLQLVQDFGICSRAFHLGDATTYRGYLLQNFEDAWERYLPPLTVCSRTETAFATNAALVNS